MRSKNVISVPQIFHMRRTVVGLLICLSVMLVVQRSHIVHGAPNLLAGYGFSEGAGTTTADASGNGLTGTLVGGPAWTAGKNGRGLSFNGSTSYVDVGNPTALQLTGSMTVSAWVFETANVADDGQIVSKSNGSAGWQLKSTPDTGPRTFGIAITSTTGASIQRYSSTARALNTWYHVAGVYDAAARTLNIYVNGTLTNGTLSGTVPTSQGNAPVNVNIGRRTGGFYINGTLDDVRIYNRALSAAEIQGDMATGVGSSGPDTTPPSAPVSLTATAVSSSQINLSWPASTDNIGVAGYKIFRNSVQVGTATTTSYVDTTGLSPLTTYTYTVAAYDQAGNTSALSPSASATTQGISFNYSLSNDGNKSVNRGAATTSMISAALLSGATQAVSFSASGLPSGASASFTPTSCSPGCSTTMTITTAAATPTGSATITVTGTAGALVRSTSFTLTVNAAADTQVPTVSVTAPLQGATVAGTTTVTGSAADNVGVVGVQFLLDGASLGAEDTTAPYSVSWNTTAASSGSHALSAKARDAAGNVGNATAINVVVDNVPPTGTVTINGGAVATNSTAVALTLSATDQLSNVTQMRFSNSGNSYSTAEAFATSKSWTLTNGGGTKTVFVQFRDAVGNWSGAFTDTIVVDTTAPTISGVQATNVTGASASISWTTSEGATSRVEYGPTTAYGSSTAFDPTLVTAHSVVVSGLSALTTYNYRVRSIDPAGNERIGTNGTFTTTGTDTTPPTAPAGLAAVVVSSTEIDLTWTASTDNVGVVNYNVFRAGTQIGSSSSAAFADLGLQPTTTYTYLVYAVDAAGNVSPGSSVTATTVPFNISNVTASAVTATTAEISWDTDQPATSQIEYGVTPAYGSITPLDVTLTTSHTHSLAGLTANTTYYYRVRSVDAGSHLVVSGGLAFSTNPASSAGSFENEILITGLNLPTAVKFLPDGHMLVLELGGRIRRVHTDDWSIEPVPFLTITNIGTLNGQQGLMDLVLDPAFSTNHFYYVFYTLGSPNHDRVSRFTATADLSSTVAGSEFVIYEDPQTANAEHHGGALNFANDGKLLVTTGEHFNADDSQSLTSPRGKVLRFNTNGTVPTDNPFYDGAGPNVDAIWARGLRNPFRAFYDSPTGRFYIADVGGNDYSTAQEEVNLGARAANYGWPLCEGSSCAGNSAFTSPLFAYPHRGRDASITGGFIYRGSQFPAEYQGNYFYADYAQNWIRRLTLDAAGNVTGSFNFEPSDGSLDGPYGDIVDLTQGPDGALYYVDLGYSDTTGQTGISKIRRIRFVSNDQSPIVVSSAQPTEGQPPLTVMFSTAGTLDPEGEPLSYSWTFGDGTTSTEANPVHIYSAKGAYSARVTVSDGVNETLGAPMTIQVGTKPAASILSPVNGATFRAGDAITFSGEATDAEDGSLPASAFTWNIDFLHEGHVHPGLPQVGTKSGTFTIPTTGHDFSGLTRYRITLTVTDSDGLQASQSVTIYPEKVALTFDTAPSGLTMFLDGIAHTTPFNYDTLVGFTHTIEAPAQTAGGSSYTFASWSDGGAQQHAIQVPTAAASYVATMTGTANPLPTGLVAGYRFSESTGTTTADMSGGGNNGVLVNTPVWATGKYGGGLTFDGNDYVDVGNGSSLQLTGSMTLSAWIKITAQPGDDGTIVGKLAGAGWQLKTSPDTGVRTAAIQISSNGSNSIQRYSSTILTTGTWYHIAGVYNAATKALDIYVNGVLDNGDLAGTIPSAQFNAPVNVNIAQRTGSPGLFNFLGTIDEVHIFNRALTAAEIQADMSNPR
jgi:glucose/arabinose dehydrogenase/PKD repeat protein/fibronectin type 3 domain-containing protein